MGSDFDIKAFTKAFIENAEKLINGEGSVNNDGELSAEEKKALPSVFSEALKQTKANADIKPPADFQFDIGSVMGLEKTQSVGDSQPANAPRRAGEGDDEIDHTETTKEGITIIYYKNGNIKIEITSKVNFNMSFNISDAIKDQITKILNQYFEGLQLNLEQMFKDIQQNFTNLFSYISGIYLQLSKLDKLDEIMNILNTLSQQIEAQTKNINNLGIQITGFENMVKKMFDMLMKKLVKLGFNVDYLVKLAEENAKNNEEQNQMLTKIYTAINTLNDKFGDFSEEVKGYYNNIVAKLETGQLTMNQMVALLNVINNTTQNNQKLIIDLMKQVKDGKTEILTAIAQLGDKFVEYGDKILEILGNIDIDKISEKLDEISKLLEVIKTQAEKNGTDINEVKKQTTEILELVKKFPEYVNTITSLINKTNGNVEKVYKFLVEMEKQDRADHKEVMDKLAIIQGLIENLPDGADIQAILTAISNLSAQNAQETKAILDAIENIEIEVDFKEVLDAIDELSKQNEQETEKILKAIRELAEKIPPYKDYDAALKLIFDAIIDLTSKVEIFEANVYSSFESVITSIDNLSTTVGDNISALNVRFNEIMTAIREHHVEVKIAQVPSEDPEGNTIYYQYTYVDCLGSDEDNETQAGNAARAPRRTSSGESLVTKTTLEYECLLNGITPPADENELLAIANENRAKAGAPQAKLVQDMGTNGISNPALDTNRKYPVYDLKGVLVSKNGVKGLPNGVYIINGKKVVHRN